MLVVHALGKITDYGRESVCGRTITKAYPHAQTDSEITCKNCLRRLGIEKPTMQQIAWVFRHITDNAIKEEGTFRHLIYDRMGLNSDAYQLLYESGGMAINNGLLKQYHEGYEDDSEL
jgi:hypothetical protein